MNICGYDFIPCVINSIKEKTSAVYCLVVEGEIHYVGATTNLSKRILDHTRITLRGTDFTAYYFECESPFEIESSIIKNLKPSLNVVWNKDCENNKLKRKRKEVFLDQIVIDKLANKSAKQNRSLKNYMELVLMDNANQDKG